MSGPRLSHGYVWSELLSLKCIRQWLLDTNADVPRKSQTFSLHDALGFVHLGVSEAVAHPVDSSALIMPFYIHRTWLLADMYIPNPKEYDIIFGGALFNYRQQIAIISSRCVLELGTTTPRCTIVHRLSNGRCVIQSSVYEITGTLVSGSIQFAEYSANMSESSASLLPYDMISKMSLSFLFCLTCDSSNGMIDSISKLPKARGSGEDLLLPKSKFPICKCHENQENVARLSRIYQRADRMPGRWGSLVEFVQRKDHSIYVFGGGDVFLSKYNVHINEVNFGKAFWSSVCCKTMNMRSRTKQMLLRLAQSLQLRLDLVNIYLGLGFAFDYWHYEYLSLGETREAAFMWGCPYCPKSFGLKGNRKTHIRTIHEQPHIRPFICMYCGIGFKEKGKLTRHVQRLHN